MLDKRMNEESIDAQALDARIVRALDKSPDARPFIPEDFAVRMARRIPVKKAISLRPTYYGRNAMLLSMAALLVVLVVMALGGHNSAVGIVLDWCLCAQLIALAMWLSLRRRGLS